MAGIETDTSRVTDADKMADTETDPSLVTDTDRMVEDWDIFDAITELPIESECMSRRLSIGIRVLIQSNISVAWDTLMIGWL